VEDACLEKLFRQARRPASGKLHKAKARAKWASQLYVCIEDTESLLAIAVQKGIASMRHHPKNVAQLQPRYEDNPRTLQTRG
jgi:uncharacterized protein